MKLHVDLIMTPGIRQNHLLYSISNHKSIEYIYIYIFKNTKISIIIY